MSSTNLISFAIFLILTTFANARPQEDFSGAIQETIENVDEALVSKTAMVSMLVNNSIDATFNATIKVLDQLPDIDWESALNETEDSIKENKIQMITALFDAKRQIIRAFGAAKDQQTENAILLFNQTLAQIELAIEATTSGLVISKEFLSEIIENLTVENVQQETIDLIVQAQNATLEAYLEAKETAEQALIEANEVILEAFNTTTLTMEATGAALIQALMNTKEKLQTMIENFDSQQTLHQGNTNVGLFIQTSLQGAETAAADAGIFDIIDTFVHNLGSIPTKINTILSSTMDEVEMDSEERIETVNDSERPKRAIDDENAMEGVLKTELKFWNQMNMAIQRQMRSNL